MLKSGAFISTIMVFSTACMEEPPQPNSIGGASLALEVEGVSADPDYAFVPAADDDMAIEDALRPTDPTTAIRMAMSDSDLVVLARYSGTERGSEDRLLFIVDESWRGDDEHRRVIRVAGAGGACGGLQPVIDRRYVLLVQDDPTCTDCVTPADRGAGWYLPEIDSEHVYAPGAVIVETARSRAAFRGEVM